MDKYIVKIDNKACTEEPNFTKWCPFKYAIGHTVVYGEYKPDFTTVYACKRHGMKIKEAQKICKLKEIVVIDE